LAGTYYVSGLADVNGQVVESVEGNNGLSGNLVVR